MHLYAIDGAVKDVAADATAFSHRNVRFAANIVGAWPDPTDNADNIQWVRDYYDALSRHSSAGGYVNFRSEDDADRVRANYGPNFDRLARIKGRYDPHNLFHLNQNIEPQG